MPAFLKSCWCHCAEQESWSFVAGAVSSINDQPSECSESGGQVLRLFLCFTFPWAPGLVCLERLVGASQAGRL